MHARWRVKLALARVWRRLVPRPRHQLAPIMCYHSIQGAPHSYCVTPEAFEAQLDYLRAHFTVVPLSRLVEAVRSHGAGRPLAAITFDDGYTDNFANAFPILERLGCPATVFVPTGFIEGEVRLIEEPGFESLTWDQIRTMRRHGVEFGAHGHTHRILSTLPDSEVEREVHLSKQVLEARLSEPIRLFAYPNGQPSDFDRRVVQLLQETGFEAACSTVWGTRNTIGDLYALRRVVIEHDDDLEAFRLKVDGAYDYIGVWHRPHWRGLPG